MMRAVRPLDSMQEKENMSISTTDLPKTPAVTTNTQLPAQHEQQPAPPEQPKQNEPAPTNAEPDQKADPEVDAKTRANRENAEKSSGPRTSAGREASSKNAVKHGLFAEDLAPHLSEEQMERYSGLRLRHR